MLNWIIWWIIVLAILYVLFLLISILLDRMCNEWIKNRLYYINKEIDGLKKGWKIENIDGKWQIWNNEELKWSNKIYSLIMYIELKSLEKNKTTLWWMWDRNKEIPKGKKKVWKISEKN